MSSLEGKTVNKSQLIDALAARYEGNRKQAAHALDSVLDTITREVAKGEKVAITGFGSFEKTVRNARWVRNPQTGERMKSKKKAVPKFTPGQDLKNIISGAKKLPKLTAANMPKPPTSVRAAASAVSGAAAGAASGFCGRGVVEAGEVVEVVVDASDAVAAELTLQCVDGEGVAHGLAARVGVVFHAHELLIGRQRLIERRKRGAGLGLPPGLALLFQYQSERPQCPRSSVRCPARPGTVTCGVPVDRSRSQSAAAVWWLRTAPGPPASTPAIHTAFGVSGRCPTA